MSESDRRVRVRTASASDEAVLRALDGAAWSPESGFPSLFGSDRAFFTPDCTPDDHLLAEIGGEVVGYIRLQPLTRLPEHAHVLAVNGLAVARSARRRGVASALLAAAERRARERGLRKITLRVLGTNAGAHRLYESCGFHREGVLRHEFLIDGAYVDDVIMAKMLDGS